MASELQRQQRVSAREQSVQTITNNNLTWIDTIYRKGSAYNKIKTYESNFSSTLISY
jgi:hypothetical protein